ncbi:MULTISPECIES: 50S ribosomal protein L25/general stress protein Ctc [Comamonas]|jgi:large subunit ribosomal protein L25|uniref:Large ribosomal subunit protein bL25 n=1 Tax=Comamonas terrigena TaxID=32013 RepID=A0A2A7UST9_COMTR|nr:MULTISPECIES: 50S ribosomal protein L25/general stress protein Ctc [Comamonas]MBD9533126.1 50S ribosomal protein L25/general stress protein Ctc [Comamonas sp. CMM01]MBV7418632.1 50S ribosomal protein L25/general stress protein Ctc [Comamonas sp. CMM03]MDH0047850.1 50S ribosomal protein L25/general stress protein Ctc [Comamonas terrigena]MDH0510550.1 50S ribosomal protein L25/general stress protein Ctc [Comamonas terrigena]MDH1090152.1 50S ribosomal protein L25/general stress protein Ctc [Co
MKFAATSRALQGTGASRRLRNSGNTPGIIYGGAAEAQLIELNHNNLFHALKKEVFHSSILDLDVDGKETKVVLRDVQFHPYKPLVLHVDFQRVDATTKVHLKVPVHLTGLEESPAVKGESCTVTQLIHELDVVCMPSALPEFINVDLSALTSKSVVGLQSVKLPNGVKAVVRGSNKNPALISIKLPEVAPEAGAAAAAAPAAPAKKGKK